MCKEFEEFYKAKEAEFRAKMLEEFNASKVKGSWEPVGGDYYVDVDGSVDKCDSSDACKAFGHERATYKLAEKAAAKMRVFNRALTFVDEACGGYDHDPKKDNYKVSYCTDYLEYFADVECEEIYRSIGTIYMPKEVAEELAKKLNSGEVVL